MPRFFLLPVWAVLFALAAVPALAEKRVALVVGNSAYQFADALANPQHDATDVAAALKKLGFEVIDGLDLDKSAFDRKLRDFATALSGATAGLFFYAGHGMQVAGQNYLVPVDAQLANASALEFEMIKLEVVQRIMENETSTNILFLDACRNNPLARNLARAMGTRSAEIGRGLAPVVSGVGTLISFSTQPGNVASDGAGRNSPFAGALVKRVATSKDDLSAILINVRNDVIKETQSKQVPWEHSALRGRFYFTAVRQATTPAKAAGWQLSEAAEAWDRTKDSKNVAALELFATRYKDTYYGDLARLRLNELKKQPVAVATSKPADATSAKAALQVQQDVEEAERQYAGRGVARDYVKARQSYEKAAAAGHAGAMSWLGWLHENGFGTPRDYSKARVWYEKAAASGNTAALNNLGRLYREGWGVPQDYAKARALYEKAIAADDADGLANLGWLYHNGLGVPKDYAKARELYEKAIAKDSAPAMNNMGVIYERGQGLTKDEFKAREWYEKSATAGNDFGMNNVGRAFENGWGVAQDYAKAREWFEKAATAGNRLAKGNLARLLDEGKGGPSDFAQAAKLLLEAARSGNNDVIEMMQGDMQKWTKGTRTELKRELARLGHYKGAIDDTWDGRIHTAVGKYLGQGG